MTALTWLKDNAPDVHAGFADFKPSAHIGHDMLDRALNPEAESRTLRRGDGVATGWAISRAPVLSESIEIRTCFTAITCCGTLSSVWRGGSSFSLSQQSNLRGEMTPKILYCGIDMPDPDRLGEIVAGPSRHGLEQLIPISL